MPWRFTGFKKEILKFTVYDLKLYHLGSFSRNFYDPGD
jgi:hypothetical protein